MKYVVYRLKGKKKEHELIDVIIADDINGAEAELVKTINDDLKLQPEYKNRDTAALISNLSIEATVISPNLERKEYDYIVEGIVYGFANTEGQTVEYGIVEKSDE